jgi:hypothetical protein
MHIEWYGQSAFRLTDGSTTVFIDPFADMTPILERSILSVSASIWSGWPRRCVSSCCASR